MAHATEVVGFERPADLQFTIVISCCGEHEHRHTVGPEVLLSLPGYTSLADSLKWAHQEAAKNHQAALDSVKTLEALKGQTVEHP